MKRERCRFPKCGLQRMGAAVMTAAVMAMCTIGCGNTPPPSGDKIVQKDELRVAAIPSDGNIGDVTCRGSYSAGPEEIQKDAVVASAGEGELTLGQLQVWYWLAAEFYRQSGQEAVPDFSIPLDAQPCPVDASVNSWQQYFLKQALNAWHTSQALAAMGADEGVPTEKAFQPSSLRDTYITGMPATSVLYGYYDSYVPNSMHQKYLDEIPAMLDALAQERGFADADALAQAAIGAEGQALADCAALLNRGYMYFTERSYEILATAEEIAVYLQENQTEKAAREKTVSMRHILLVPQGGTVAENGTVTCSEQDWEACRETAQALLDSYLALEDRAVEQRFAELACANSADANSAAKGGFLENLTEAQLARPLAEWLFAESRKDGDTAILRSDCGYHVVYFSGSTDGDSAAAEEALTVRGQWEILTDAVDKYAANVDYENIRLGTAAFEDAAITLEDLLYPDVAHERFPEMPLYLQQDYGNTKYGYYNMTTHGCGIASLAMVATYLTDELQTPPVLGAKYGQYCMWDGSDISLFPDVSADLGIYLKAEVWNHEPVKEALLDGHVAIVGVGDGVFTTRGHYVVLAEMPEEDMIRVRDPNMCNYTRLVGHSEDLFTWSNVTSSGKGYWIYEKKMVRIPVCVRCGDGSSSAMFAEEFLCSRCSKAVLRRQTFLTAVL